MKFYVYVYRDPRPTKGNAPVYIGKGTGHRDTSHQWRSHNKPLQDFLSHLKRNGLTPSVERVFETDDEQAAFAKEVELIALYGRKNNKTGILFNLTDGGEGGSGAIQTPEHRAVTGRFSIERWQDPEYRAKVIARQKEVNARPEVKLKRAATSRTNLVNNPEISKRMAAGRATLESRAKTSAQATAQWADPSYREKMAAIKAEIDNRPEVSEARSTKLQAKWDDPVKRAARVGAMKVAAQSKYKSVHVMPEDKTYESVTALIEVTGIAKSVAYRLLKGEVLKKGAFAGWSVQYVTPA